MRRLQVRLLDLLVLVSLVGISLALIRSEVPVGVGAYFGFLPGAYLAALVLRGGWERSWDDLIQRVFLCGAGGALSLVALFMSALIWGPPNPQGPLPLWYYVVIAVVSAPLGFGLGAAYGIVEIAVLRSNSSPTSSRN